MPLKVLKFIQKVMSTSNEKQMPMQTAKKALNKPKDESRDDKGNEVGELIATASASLYQPLNPSTQEIRLIMLLPGKSPTPISCLLTVASLESDITNYEALSYEWGDAKGQKSTIQLQGQEVSIRQNLWLFLEVLRSEDQEQVFWIDAICINQADINERGSQVEMMGNIYRRASVVRAWLGPAVEANGTEKNTNFEWSLEDVRTRSYWSRVWIIQEILLAREAYFYCGRNCINWTDLKELMSNPENDSRSGRNAPRTYGDTVLGFKSMFPKEGASSQNSLLALMEAFPLSQCSLLHDKLYGLLGVASDVPQGSIKVNYNASIGEVIMDVLKWFCEGNCQIDGMRPEFVLNYLAMLFGDGHLCSRGIF
jgi:hypothetical protein